MTKGTPTDKGGDASSTLSVVRKREQRARWPVAWRRAAPTRSQRTRVATPPRSFSIPPARPTRAQRFDKTAITGVADATNAEPAPTRGKRMRAATPRPLSPFRRPAQRGRRALTRPRSRALSTRRASDPAPTLIGLLRFNRASAPTHRPHWANAPASSPRRPIPRRPPTRSSCRRSLASNKKAPEQPDARAQSADLLRRLSNRPTAKDRGIKKAGSPPQRRRTRCVGSPSRARTCDTWINSPPLYRLSYQGIKLARCAWNRPRRFFARETARPDLSGRRSNRLAPRAGLEPATHGLTVHRSTD